MIPVIIGFDGHDQTLFIVDIVIDMIFGLDIIFLERCSVLIILPEYPTIEFMVSFLLILHVQNENQMRKLRREKKRMGAASVENEDGTLKPFGLGYTNKTVIPAWIVAIILGILCYYVVMVYFTFF